MSTINDLLKQSQERVPPVSVASKISTGVHLRLDPVGSFDMPQRRATAITPFNLSTIIAIDVVGQHGKNGSVMLGPPIKDSTITITSDFEDGTNVTAEFNAAAYDVQDEQWGFLLAALMKLNVQGGCSIKLESHWPAKSGLGGSGALRGALIANILTLRHKIHGEREPTVQLVSNWAHQIDDFCLHDRDVSDVTGSLLSFGVFAWDHEGEFDFAPYAEAVIKNLAERMIVAYTHEEHNAIKEGLSKTDHLQQGRDNAYWQRLAENSRKLITAFDTQSWDDVVQLLTEHADLKQEISPSYISPKHREVLEITQRFSGGMKTAGSGNGGCAMVVLPDTSKMEELQQEILATGAWILDASISRELVLPIDNK